MIVAVLLAQPQHQRRVIDVTVGLNSTTVEELEAAVAEGLFVTVRQQPLVMALLQVLHGVLG